MEFSTRNILRIPAERTVKKAVIRIAKMVENHECELRKFFSIIKGVNSFYRFSHSQWFVLAYGYSGLLHH